MTTWYVTSNWGKRIEPVEVEKSTDKSVWIEGNRRALISDYSSHFPTWAEAKEHLLGKAGRKLEAARAQLARAQAEYGNIKGLRDPNEASP